MSAPRPQQAVNLADPATFANGIPHAAFAALRAAPGLVWNPVGAAPDDGFWSVGRFDDVQAVSRDPATFSSAMGHIQIYNIDDDALEARASMIDMDPPQHSRLRRLVQTGFMPKPIRAYVPVIREMAGEIGRAHV